MFACIWHIPTSHVLHFSFHTRAVSSFFQIRIESLFFTAKSAKVAKTMLPQLCVLCVLCGELLHKLYISTAMAEPHHSPRPPPASQNTRAFIIYSDADTLTSCGVECLLRPQSVQVTRIYADLNLKERVNCEFARREVKTRRKYASRTLLFRASGSAQDCFTWETTTHSVDRMYKDRNATKTIIGGQSIEKLR